MEGAKVTMGKAGKCVEHSPGNFILVGSPVQGAREESWSHPAEPNSDQPQSRSQGANGRESVQPP